MDESILNQTLSDRYRITERIKAGGVAVVYKAIDERSGDTVAIKMLQSSWAEHEEVIYRFEREAKIMQHLIHPHIVRYRDQGRHQHRPFIVMDYVDGGSLSEQLKDSAQITLGNAAQLIAQVADALDYAHRMDIVHRDLKPGNILLESETNAKLTDFGIARIIEGTMLTMTGHMPGTPHYMSPEQARGQSDLDALSDQYSLAVIAYLLATGNLPFTGTDSLVIINQHLSAMPTAPTLLNEELPQALDGVLLKALAKAPEDRYESVNAFSAAFQDAVKGHDDLKVVLSRKRQNGPQFAANPPIPQPTLFNDDSGRSGTPTTAVLVQGQEPQRRSRLPVLLLVLLLILMSILAFIALSDNRNGGNTAVGNQETRLAVAETTQEATETPTQTDTPSPTSTETYTPTPTLTETATGTPSATSTDTLTPTESPTPTPTETQTLTPSITATITETPDLTRTEAGLLARGLTLVAQSATPTYTPTYTETPSSTPTPTYTRTPTSTPTATPVEPIVQTVVAFITANPTAIWPITGTPLPVCYIYLQQNIDTVPIYVGPGFDRSRRGDLRSYLRNRNAPAGQINGKITDADGNLWWRLLPSRIDVFATEEDRFWIPDRNEIAKIGECDAIPSVQDTQRFDSPTITPTATPRSDFPTLAVPGFPPLPDEIQPTETP